MRGNNKEPIVRVVGRAGFLASISVGNQIDSLALNDTINTQLSSLSDMYGLYRFTKIRLVLPPNLSVGATSGLLNYGVAFTPEALLTVPTTFVEAVQLPYWVGHGLVNNGTSAYGGGRNESFTVPRRDLMKVGVKWFRTQGKGTETDWETQGTFVYAVSAAVVSSAATFRGWIEYECEFTDQLPLASTLRRRREEVPAYLPPKPLASGISPPDGDKYPKTVTELFEEFRRLNHS